MGLSESISGSPKTRPLSVATDAVCFNEAEYSSNCKGVACEDTASLLSQSQGCEECNKLTAYKGSRQPAKRRKDSSAYYDMSGDKILIIFNHFKFKKNKREEDTRHHRKTQPKTREGTYEDVKNLENTFRRLGFMVITHDDWKYKDIMQYLNDVCRKDHRNTSCVAVAVMTHGKGSRLCAADRKYPVVDITETLRSAPSLAGKPKLFFIQACRTGHTQPEPLENDGLVFSLNEDCLLLYSTYEDHFSYRHSYNGSWMMEALCEVIGAHHDSLNILQMITLVNRMVAAKSSKYGKQMPVTEFNLKKFLMF